MLLMNGEVKSMLKSSREINYLQELPGLIGSDSPPKAMGTPYIDLSHAKLQLNVISYMTRKSYTDIHVYY